MVADLGLELTPGLERSDPCWLGLHITGQHRDAMTGPGFSPHAITPPRLAARIGSGCFTLVDRYALGGIEDL